MLSRKYPTLENQEKYKQFKNQNLSNQRKAERKYYNLSLINRILRNHGKLSKI